jgi:PAS domain S-box-containing protein
VADESRQLLTSPHVQATLLAETVQTAEVGLLVWDDDRHYVAANAAACALLGCTLEELLESVVGDRTVEGQEVVDQVVRERGGRGRVTFERFDGGQATVEYLTFATRTAGMPHMASVIWPAEEDASS